MAKVDGQAITEIKGFTKPPELCEFVMEAVMLYIGKKANWDTAKKEMQNAQNFLKQLKELKVDSLTEKTLGTIRKKYLDKKDKFDIEKIKKQSEPAANLATWAQAMSNYQKVYKLIVPKKKKLAEVEAVLAEAKAELDKKLAKVKKVKDRVAELEATANKLNADKTEMEFKMNQSRSRMGRAEKLVLLLEDEGVRWKKDVEVMTVQIEKLVGNVFLSCACISYFGAFTGEYRKLLTD